MYLDPGVDITLFSISFAVRRATVIIQQNMGQCNLSPPTVSMVLLGSFFSGL